MNVDEFRKRELSRRQFLGQSAQNAAGMAAGMVGFSAGAAHAAPGERVRLGVIGVRHRGKQLTTAFAGRPDADVVALCDVDENLLPAAARAVNDLQERSVRCERDFRRLLDDAALDAVVIATPDHWHAAMTVLACQAGKDVYVEMPVSHSLAEGRQMVEAARRYERVVQAGLQQRSSGHFRSAIELVRSGQLGKVRMAKAWCVHRRKPIGSSRPAEVPKGVDYEQWLGPAAAREFDPLRFHYNWRWFWDYGGGELGHWGGHMLDVARWGLDARFPQRISATGGKYAFEDAQETPDTLVVNYSFGSAGAAAKTIVWEHRLWTTHAPEGRSTAAAFYGERGTLVVDRGGWKVYDTSDPQTSAGRDQLEQHCADFLTSVRTRRRPAADVETGHVSSGLCHLGNAAYRLGREIRFDGETLECPEDAAATALINGLGVAPGVT